MQRNTAKYNLLIAQARTHISYFFSKFSYLAERFFGHAVVFNSLENEPMAVTKQFTQL